MLDRIKVITSMIIIMVLLLGSSISLEGKLVSAADGEEVDLSQIELPEKGNPKLDSHLNQLASAPRLAASFAQKGNGQAAEDTVRVIVECLTDQKDAAARAADDLGSVEASYDNLLQMTVSVAQLTALADTPGVQFVRLPWQPLPAAVSEGVALINADDWHAVSYNGTGVKVGILDVGFTDYADLLGTELPASVTVKSFYTGSDIEGDTDHGTACAEIVYDIAPCADFYLTNFNTVVEMGNAVDWLIAKDVDVISCSICWPGCGPGDGTGLICNMVKKARDAGILWSQAMGNSAQRHWQGIFTDANKNRFHDFKKSPIDETNTIYVNDGDTIIVVLNWNDTWGHSANDYDLYLIDDSLTTIVAGSEHPQDGNDDPWEGLGCIAPYTGDYHIIIHKYHTTRAVNFSLYSYNHELEYAVAVSSFEVPADSPYAMTVGAVFWHNPTTLEPFSSQGPTKDNRKKPDLVAPDGVSTATYGDSDGVQPPDGTGFFGTSASAPHGAGAAVLVKSLYPSFTPAQIQSFLESRAVPLGAPGKDNLYGSGRLDLGPLPPEAPSGLTATAISSTQIDLSWTDNSNNEAGFKIERKTGSTAYAQIATVGAGVTSYSSTGLRVSTTYSYRVRAYNAGGNSDYSEEASAKTLPLPPPAPRPKSLKKNSTAYRLTPSLEWNVSKGASNYGLQVATDAGFTSLVVDKTGIADTHYDVTPELKWNKTYYWRVNARNSSGSPSRWSISWYFKTAAGPPPEEPSGLTATAVSSTQIDLSWTDNSADETGFKIERKVGSTIKWTQIATVVANATSYSDSKLKASTTYSYRIRAYNAANSSDYSDEDAAKTLPVPPPVPRLKSPKKNSTTDNLTPRLEWNASKGASDYGLQVATDAAFTSPVINEPVIADTTYYNITSALAPNTKYYWRVNARNSSGSPSKWSISWYFTTPS